MQLQFNLVGLNHYSFTDPATGKLVDGYKFHLNRPVQSQNFKGLEATSLTVSSALVQKLGEPQVNTVYDVTYDPKGRIVHYAPASRTK